MNYRNAYAVVGISLIAGISHANLLANGDLDRTYEQEIVPNFFLPKPHQWVNEGSRATTGAYEDEMSSEPWAGPSPTPVTSNGFNVTTNTANGQDWAVFWKPFSGGGSNGLATGHLYQDVAGTAGMRYTFSGWAGAEANALMRDAVFAIDFMNSGGGLLSSVTLSLLPTLYVGNNQPFNYKNYSVSGTAPAGTAWVRSRVSMLDAQTNPLGGGQAFVTDDFTLTAVPEPGTVAALGFGALLLARRRSSKR